MGRPGLTLGFDRLIYCLSSGYSFVIIETLEISDSLVPDREDMYNYG